jgi:hypothetical protein
MRNKLGIGLIIGLSVLSIGFLQSCKNDDPTVLKVYLKDSEGSDLNAGYARVVIVGDLDSNPATGSYVDTMYTDSYNLVTFNMDPYFDEFGGEDAVGYFDIYVKLNNEYGEGRIRCRKNLTATETVYINQ